MDQIIPDGKNLPSASGRCVAAGYREKEWGTSKVSDRATSILVVCQRPLKCNHIDNAAFRQRRQDALTTLTKRPFAGFPLQRLELVGKLGPLYQSHQMQLHLYWTGSFTSIIPCHLKSGQFHTGHKRC